VSRAADARAHYTPPVVVDFMGREALKAHLAGTGDAAPEAIARWIDRGDASLLTRAQSGRLRERLQGLRVMDPACGQGALLVGFLDVTMAAWRALRGRQAWGDDAASGGAGAWAGTPGAPSLYGIELDAAVAVAARARLAQALTAHAPQAPAPGTLTRRVIVADALTAWPAAEVPRTFDIVLVNPPYLNMVAMEARDARERRRLRATYRTARGCFDLFVPFIELSIDLLAPGGVLAALTPDKLLGAQYAADLREHYRERMDLLALADLTDTRPFAAGVYPVVTIGRRRPADEGAGGSARPPAGSPAVHIWRGAQPGGPLELHHTHAAPAHLLDCVGNRWGALLDRECEAIAGSLGRLPRLAELADVCGAATVTEAYAWQPAIVDRGRDLWERDPDRYAPFVVSGNIVGAGHTWASRAVRYLGRSYREPVLDLRHPAVSARRRRQIRAGKIILSGLARRPTCVWDEGGVAAGKSTVLVIPRPGVRGAQLAAVLNGDEAARIYRLLFGVLALSGGYLRFGPPQMRALPVPLQSPAVRESDPGRLSKVTE